MFLFGCKLWIEDIQCYVLCCIVEILFSIGIRIVVVSYSSGIITLYSEAKSDEVTKYRRFESILGMTASVV